ncbi:CpsD/CapB family tyrosine-protein kinase [Frisingicoccus sp.]|uniref:CpsD/CapB family tyrosine-protein kinase n=1 Tax=Frisingicoccus sp. TaxID=1918627 RepID=UPI003AB583A1
MQSIQIKIPALDRRTDEAYKTLRTNLQFCGKDIRSIVITSCTPSEGKSEISLHLAKSLSESGKRVLFIDADLRKSVIISRCQVSQTVKGLSHYLSGQSSFADIVYSTSVHNLHMIFAGPVPPNPTELLGTNNFKLAIEKLKTVYDYIIVDTPPLGSVIDGAVVANECDGSILIIGANEISRRFAKKVVEQLKLADCPVLGVILNKVDSKQNGYGRYYGKYYGKYYGENAEKYLEE